MDIDTLVKRLQVRLAEVEGGPSGANGADNSAYLRGIARGLEIAITMAKTDPTVDPRAECERMLRDFNDDTAWRRSQQRQVTDSYGNHVGWR